jgi:anti-sigma regulatory factor (Ser/Thr protein kinase)
MNESNGDDHLKSSVIGEISRLATPSAVPELLDFVATIEREEGFSPERREEIGTALKEALQVVVTRAYGEKGGEVKIACKHDAWGKLAIVIVDSGAPINILLSDAVLPGGELLGDVSLRDSARLIKKMIDNVEYKRVDNENTLSFFVSGELRTR